MMASIVFGRRAVVLLAAAALVPAFATAVRAQEEAAEGGGNPLFNIDIGLGIWTIVVFLTLLWVLRRFAWRPILAALAAREERIEKAIADAARLRDQAAQLLEEHRKQLAEAREHAQQILAESRQAAERLRREMEDRARR
ncbi:MAG: ATP synthase F0 subunit B, partial [Gemmatimonadetes bacterium]|nr:ATP synthase F0 subunit B [Gemmatimonadota bacterium]